MIIIWLDFSNSSGPMVSTSCNWMIQPQQQWIYKSLSSAEFALSSMLHTFMFTEIRRVIERTAAPRVLAFEWLVHTLGRSPQSRKDLIRHLHLKIRSILSREPVHFSVHLHSLKGNRHSNTDNTRQIQGKIDSLLTTLSGALLIFSH